MITKLEHEGTLDPYFVDDVNHLGETVSRGFFSRSDAENFVSAWGLIYEQKKAKKTQSGKNQAKADKPILGMLLRKPKGAIQQG